MGIEQQFMELCRDTVAQMGFNLVRVAWADRELCLYIDVAVKTNGVDKTDVASETGVAGGVTLNDCEMVTKAVEPIIDANDGALGENYSLSVSSIGIDGKDWR
jgi:ribosome maturation factor RimP